MNKPPEDEWLPALPGDLPAGRFKWGWNARTGEAVVWSVYGPGDGRPFHHEFLRSVWGRDPDRVEGDLFGLAESWDADPASGGRERVIVDGYASAVPGAVLAWFRREFPNADVLGVPDEAR